MIVRTVVYYTGNLMYDRRYGGDRLARGAINQTAKRMWMDYLGGLCTLTQKRVGPNKWDYQAHFYDKPVKPVVQADFR